MKFTKTRLALIFLVVFFGQSQSQSVSDIATLIREGQSQRAKQALQRIEDRIPADQALFLKGLLSTTADSAFLFYHQLLDDHPESTYKDDALYRLAQSDYAQGLYRSAQAKFSEIIKLYPNSPLHQRCEYWIAHCYSATAQVDSAEAHLEKVIDDYRRSDYTEMARDDIRMLRRESHSDEEQDAQDEKLWAVQVNSFTQQNSALHRKSFYEAKGYEVKLRSSNVNGVTYYKVWVGSYRTRDEAKAAEREIRKRFGVPDSFVVSE